MEPGTIADWVNAGGTYLAFSGAVLAAAIAVRSLRTQRASFEQQLEVNAANEQRRVNEERRSQASKVAFWVFRGRYHWYVSGVNASGLPVFRLTIHVYCDEPHLSVAFERGTQGPADVAQSGKLTNALRVMLKRNDAEALDPNSICVDICFTDAAGRRWHRAHMGELVEVPDSFNFHEADERVIDRLVAEEEGGEHS